MTEQRADYPIVDDVVRSRRLAHTVAMMSVTARVESQSQFNATLVSGHRINHLLHAVLTLFTCLLWGIVWIVLASKPGEIRHAVMVDEYGRVWLSRGTGQWVQHPEFEI